MIKYLTGDATKPHGEGNKIIAHVCNNIGKWGRGFVLSISRRWKIPESMYRKWHTGTLKQNKKFGLGEVQVVRAENGIWIANMVAQDGIYTRNGVPPIRYYALTKCLEELSKMSKELFASVHMPRIGCGLAGGKWSTVEKIINDTLVTENIPVFVYDLKRRKQ